MKIAPQMEAELAQLNRDYEIHRKNYEDLVARRESLKIGGELESSSNLADFRVIDPPRADPTTGGAQPGAAHAAVAGGRPRLWPGHCLLDEPDAPGVSSMRAPCGLRPVCRLLGVVTLIKSDTMRKQETRSLIRFVASFWRLLAVFLIGMVALVLPVRHSQGSQHHEQPD